MPDQHLVIVNYHYIREEGRDQGIHAISREAFAAQLDRISGEGYQFVALADLHEAIERKDPAHLPARGCLITFDDGLKESFDVGLSILDKKGIPAAFYIVDQAILGSEVLAVHKFQYVRSRISDDELLGLVGTLVDLSKYRFNEGTLKEQYPWDALQSAKLKYLFNFLLGEGEKAWLTDTLFAQVFARPQAEYARDLYMTAGQVRTLSDRDYLGTHSHAHRALATLSREEASEDIRMAIDAVLAMTGRRVKSISYPYGGFSAVNETIADVCREEGLVSGLTMYRGFNRAEDITKSSLLLKRLDMNDMIGGKSENIYKELSYAV